MIGLYDVFKGTITAQRCLEQAKTILLMLLNNRTKSLDSKQSEDIFKMLGKNEIKNEDKAILEFDIWLKDIMPKVLSIVIEDKKAAIKELMQIYGKTETFKQ